MLHAGAGCQLKDSFPSIRVEYKFRMDMVPSPLHLARK